MKNLLRSLAVLLLIILVPVIVRHRMEQGDIAESEKPTIIEPATNIQLARRAIPTAWHGALLEPDVESVSGEEADRPMTPEEIDAQLELLP